MNFAKFNDETDIADVQCMTVKKSSSFTESMFTNNVP